MYILCQKNFKAILNLKIFFDKLIQTSIFLIFSEPESKIDQILNPNELKPAIKEEPILRENIIRMPAVQKVEKTEMIKVKIPSNFFTYFFLIPRF